MDRVERLKVMIERNPRQPFPRYGLAMEYKNQGKTEDAIVIFEQLLKDYPDYTPAYFHFGMSLRQAGREEQAEDVFIRGIELASRKGEDHARDELQSALADLRGEA